MTDAPRLPDVTAIRAGTDRVEIDLVVRPDLFWFQGHFPDLPIMAGVVQLDWALTFATEHLGVELLPARKVQQLKFKSPIFPDDRLTLELTYMRDKARVAFEFRRGDTVCSSGHMMVPGP